MNPLLIATLLCSIPAVGADLQISPTTAGPGTTVALPVAFRSGSDLISAIQFDVEYLPRQMSLSLSVGDSTRSGLKSFHQSVSAVDKHRFLVAGLNSAPIADGTILTLYAHVGQVADGNYGLDLVNARAVDPSGREVRLAVRHGMVQVRRANLSPGADTVVVLHGATMAPGPVAPGQLVTILGSNLDALVPFSGDPATVLFSSPSRINAVLPQSLSGDEAILELRRQQTTVARHSLRIVPTSPGLFTIGGSGTGPVVAASTDGAALPAYQPIAKGAVVDLFATGAGATDPPQTDNVTNTDPLPQIIAPVSVRFGEVEAQVLASEAAPDMPAGMVRIRVAVPAEAPSGLTIPVVATIGGVQTQSGVTISLE